jgi:glycerophosphoryl diester phosphodiesterase
LWKVINEEKRTKFINYAHRGVSEYYPENTMMAFGKALEMGANGIETDVQRTKDGKLVLFHDNTLERVTGESGSIQDYTYEELQKFDVKKGELTDKIPLFEDFLKEFADKDIVFAIELKEDGVEEEVADLIYKYGIEKKATVTAFSLTRIRKVKEYKPNLRIGFLTRSLEEERINALIDMNADEVCPYVGIITAETVQNMHRLGFNVRAWGIAADEEKMKIAYEAGTDGMTINAPDLLTKLIAENNA